MNKKDAKHAVQRPSYSISSPILIAGGDKGGPDDIHKSANKDTGNNTHHHHSIPENSSGLKSG
ncbi:MULTISPECIES: hypothetical protein [Paenibacillus]|uniref:hypothetical protein n=1 Tax=Paenibacillus TaxID=44249 RepID=UPI00168ADB41|nr:MULTISPECIES: hypothetical protein [Paenibacillus]